MPVRTKNVALRVTPSPYHWDALIDRLFEALVEVWERLGLVRVAQVLVAEQIRSWEFEVRVGPAPRAIAGRNRREGCASTMTAACRGSI